MESVVVREVEKGGTAATIKSAVDRAIDQFHAETGSVRDKTLNVVTRTTDKLREKFQKK